MLLFDWLQVFLANSLLMLNSRTYHGAGAGRRWDDVINTNGNTSVINNNVSWFSKFRQYDSKDDAESLPSAPFVA